MKPASLVLLAAVTAAAQAPLPELRIEPTDGGSIIFIRNVHAQPLTAFLLELVDYPGSSYSLWQDDVADAIPPGGGKRFPVRNMIIGAVSDYVKVQAAIYEDGSTGGVPAKVAQLTARRKFVLETTLELIRRFEGATKAGVLGSLKQRLDSLPPAGKGAPTTSQAGINQAAARTLLSGAVDRLEVSSVEATLADLRKAERALAASKPLLN